MASSEEPHGFPQGAVHSGSGLPPSPASSPQRRAAWIPCDAGGQVPFSGHLGVCLSWEEQQPCVSFPECLSLLRFGGSSTWSGLMWHCQSEEGCGGRRWAHIRLNWLGEAGLAWCPSRAGCSQCSPLGVWTAPTPEVPLA